MTKKKELTRVEQLKLELAKAIGIEKGNAAFAKLASAKKRIAIAEDVILSLKSGLFSARAGSYFVLNTDNPSTTTELQDLLCDKANIDSCTVCGMAGIFASKVRLSNNFKITKGDNYVSVGDKEIIDNLQGIFEEGQLRLIECAFEGEFIKTPANMDCTTEERLEELGVEFYVKYPDEDKRMVAIMKNIIKNKGTFVL